MAEKNDVGAIWKRSTKNGKELLSITIEGKKYVAWPNEYKKEDKHPDYKVYEDTYEKPVQHQRPAAPVAPPPEKKYVSANDIEHNDNPEPENFNNPADDLPF
jgi:hypothetical protein